MAEPSVALLNIELAYSDGQDTHVCALEVPAGSSVMQAIVLAMQRQLLPAALTVDPQRIGIFARKVEPNRPVVEGDRIELYRPLQLDPMEARRRRARPAG